MNGAESIARQLSVAGVTTVFGLMGNGNLRIVPRLVDLCAIRYIGTRHEAAAVAAAQAYAHVTGNVGVCTVTKGPGLTNALTALVEASKSHSPIVLIVGGLPANVLHHNQEIGHGTVALAAGAQHLEVTTPATASQLVTTALRAAEGERRPYVVTIPTDIQDADVPDPENAPATSLAHRSPVNLTQVAAAAALLATAERPLIIAGRGALLADARGAIERLADRIGALLMTSAVARNLFLGHPFFLGTAGGFACERAAEISRQADVVLAIGASLNQWTMRHGKLLDPKARIIHCDLHSASIGLYTPVELAVVGDALSVVEAIEATLERRTVFRQGFHDDALRAELAEGLRDPFEDESTPDLVDQRSLLVELDRLIPHERNVAVDSGNFMILPSTLLSVPDPRSFVFCQAFMSVGLGFAGAIGAAAARPDRPTIAAVGDGGMMMSLGELEVAVRYELPIMALIHNDRAYGAEVWHLNHLGLPLKHAFFGDVDFAKVGRALGAQGVTIRSVADLGQLEEWIRDPVGPIVVDCRMNADVKLPWTDD